MEYLRRRGNDDAHQCALLGLLLVAGATLPLSAKGITTKIRITGATLAIPLEITDPGILKDFNVCAGPGTSMNGVEGTEGFIIDWASGALAEAPNSRDQRVETPAR